MTHSGIQAARIVAYWHTLGFSQWVLSLLRAKFDLTHWEVPSINEVINFARSTGKVRTASMDTIRERATHLAPAQWEEELEKRGITIVLRGDIFYPAGLSSSENTPEILYILGTLAPEKLAIAVVWAREVSPYGVAAVSSIVPELVRARCSIISGGALGTDTEAHEIALMSAGHTIAILGSWLDHPYPSTNTGLFERIVSSWGAIISEFPLETRAAPYTFPIRNQTIALMSRGTLVIEARERSGSLITAQAAIEAGRDVFAIPWDIGRYNSRGTNALIRSGSAKLVMEARDILTEYPELEHLSVPRVEREYPEKFASILALLESTPSTAVELSEELSMPIPQMIALMSELEMLGGIIEIGGGKYERSV